MGLFTPEPEKTKHLKDAAARPPRRDNGRRVLLISAIAAAVAAGAFLTRQDIAPVDVWIEASAREFNGALIVSGVTNLTDGAILEVWIARDVAGAGEAPDAEAVVQGGLFDTSIEFSDAEGHLVHLVFDPVRVAGPQEGDVLAVYGLFGEALDGPYVVETDRGKRVEYTARMR